MNDDAEEGPSKLYRMTDASHTKEHRAALHAVTSVIYKRAIVHAISDLQDSYLRSNVDSIRRKVQASLDKEDGGGANHHQLHTPWNETIFLKTLKSLVQNGDVEQCTSLNCGLSPEFKRKVNSKAQALCLQHQQQEQLQQQQLQQYYASQNVTELNSPHITGHHRRTFEDKETPAKKAEHFKLKIVPKRIYDNQHVPIKNPMDTF